MKQTFGALAVIGILFVLLGGGYYFYLLGELSYYRAYVPAVSGIITPHEDVRITIRDMNGGVMFRKVYQWYVPVPAENIRLLHREMVKVLNEDYASPEYQATLKERFLYRLKERYPRQVEGFIYNLYTDRLMQSLHLSPLGMNVVRWHTLKKLSDEFDENALYAVFLNNSAFGENIFGVAAAAEAFFDRPFHDLNQAEVAFLIGMLLDDTPLDPFDNFSELDKRRRVIIRYLYEKRVIDAVTYRELIRTPVRLRRATFPMVEPSYVNRVMQELKSLAVYDPGKHTLDVQTFYDPAKTDLARRALEPVWQEDEERQTAFVLINTDTRGVEVALGSRLAHSTLNRAFTSRRQMGSTMKPFVYLTALSKGWKPSDIIVDKPYIFNLGDDLYLPDNFEDYYMGRIPMRYGLVHSLNNATVFLARSVGLENVRRQVMKMGIGVSIKPYLSMPLGVFGTTPFNVAAMYATLANYGEYEPPRLISHVTVGEGERVAVVADPSRRVAGERASFQVLYMMQDVARIGTARGAGLLSGTAAKTGTSDKFVDAWTAAVFPPYVAVCWVGRDDYAPMSDRDAGGLVAAPVIARFQQLLFGDKKEFHFEPPDGIVFARVNRRTGKLTERTRGSYIEAFDEDNLPESDQDAADSAAGKGRR